MTTMTIHGSSREDAFVYSAGMTNYTLHTLGGDDLISDRSISDSFIFGGAGNDTIMDYAGNDMLDGGKGNDHFYVEATQVSHNVTVFGGKGDDTLVLEAGPNVQGHVDNGVTYYNTSNGSVIEIHGVEHVFVI